MDGATPAKATVAVARLWPGRRAELEAHYLRLSAEDRRLRFHGVTADGALRSRLDRLDWRAGVVLGIYEDGVLRAAAELSSPPGRNAAAEAAVSVEAGFRGRGFGSALLRAALAVARNRDAAFVALLWLPENRAMAALARRFGARAAFADGAVEGRIRPRRPSLGSLLAEVAFAAEGALHALAALLGGGAGAASPGAGAGPRSA